MREGKPVVWLLRYMRYLQDTSALGVRTIMLRLTPDTKVKNIEIKLPNNTTWKISLIKISPPAKESFLPPKKNIYFLSSTKHGFEILGRNELHGFN